MPNGKHCSKTFYQMIRRKSDVEKNISQCFDIDYIYHVMIVEWGISIHIMRKDGKAYARLYMYEEDPTTICLDSLSVYSSVRKQRIGTRLQEIRENIGIKLGASYSCLQVKRKSWMHKWYERRGYIDYVDSDDKNLIWMKKIIKNENDRNI